MLNDYLNNLQKTAEIVASKPDLNKQNDGEKNADSDPFASMSKEDRDALFNDKLLPLRDTLYTFAYYLTDNDLNECDELVQETYYKAYLNLHQYQTNTSVKSWLLAILRNTYYNQLKQKARHPHDDYSDIVDYQHSEVEKTPQYQHLQDHSQQNKPLNLKDSVFAGMLSDEVIYAITQVAEPYRTAMLLSDLEDLSYEEIALVLETTTGTVKSRISRGRDQMREILYSYGKEHGYKDKRRKDNHKTIEKIK